MKESIKIVMPAEDADQIQKIFDTESDISFMIVSRFDLPSGDTTVLELIAESTMDIWFLAKRVERWQIFDDRMKELIDKYKHL